jgi:hypothetical protein
VIRNWIDSVRRNHALEHATVAVLLARRGPTRLAGRASGDGFFLLADIDEGDVLSSAQEALERLQRGESGLAVSPLCGTNIAVAGFLAAAASTGALVGSARRSERFSRAFTAAMLGVIVAQPIGRLVQKYVTTSPDLAGVEIVAIRSVVGSLKKVQTRSIAAP